MKIPTHILSGVALFAAALSTSYAQTATSGAVGYRTETLAPGFNLIGANLVEKVEAAGAIDAIAGQVITDNDVDFTPLAGLNLMLKLTDGPNAGTVLQVDQSGQRTVTAVAGAAAAAVGNKYELRVSSDVAKLFGATNSAGLKPGGDLTSADNIYIPVGNGFTIVFYYDGSGFLGANPGWFDSNGAAAGNVEIPYSSAFLVKNTTAAPKNVVFVGHVIPTLTKYPAIQGFNYVSRVLPVPMTLDASLIKNQLAAGSDLSAADNVYIPGATGYKICFFYDGNGFLGATPGWFDGNGVASGTTNLTSGVLIFRRSGPVVGGVNLIIPQGLDL